ncbi:MAG: sel1 repeat family protein [Rhodoferax sp.]|nr:sel1 repeat family protein [Rhodoferax sp.]
MKQKAHQAKQLRAKASELLKRVVLVLAGIFYCTYAHAETWVNLTGAQSLEEGKAAWAKRDYVTAIKNFEPLARKGDPSVQSMVGYMFDEGLGVKQDPKKAFYWYEKAAAQGNAEAAYNLGNLYRDGRGVPQSQEKWAQSMLTSAKLGNPSAQFNVALMFTNGDHVTKDLNVAFDWLLKSAEGGDIMAQVNTGIAYAKGSGVNADYLKAYKWLVVAQRRGAPNVNEYVLYLQKRLSPTDFNTASHQVDNWLASHK